MDTDTAIRGDAFVEKLIILVCVVRETMSNEDFRKVRAALAGDAELDDGTLARVLDIAETARVDAIIECVAHLNERATLAAMTPNRSLEAAGLLRGAAALMEHAGGDRMPCPHCKDPTVHTSACPLGRAVRKWRTSLVPGKGRISS